MRMEEIVQDKLRLIFKDDSIVFDKSRFAGGLTNYNYIMNIKGTEYVVRQPGGMTNQMIDRKIEKINNRIASEWGLNSECIYFDDASGIKVSLYVQNSQNFTLADPCKPAILKEVSRLMKKTHFGESAFPNEFHWDEELIKYEEIVKELHGDFFFDYPSLKEQMFDFIKGHISDLQCVPCHNDTVPENFIIDDKGKSYLIDWEYSGMNDPSWDVAAYILESRLPEDAIEFLLKEYYENKTRKEDLMKIKCFMLVQDLLWTVWALIRHYNGEDFLDYCNFRYERFRRNLKALRQSTEYPLAEIVKN